MQKKQIAVIDINSEKLNAVICERGTNKTFVIKSSKEFLYSGFSNGEFIEIESFLTALSNATLFLADNYKEPVIYVGVPSDFSVISVKETQISFDKKTKITSREINQLFESCNDEEYASYTLINRSAVLYELDDCRKLANPYGFSTETLKGKLSFIYATNNYIELVNSILKQCKFRVEFISTPLAESFYLIDSDARDRLAILLDVGYISSTVSIIQGDGIIFEKSFSYGSGIMTAQICEKFDVDFNEAEKIKRQANLNRNYENSKFSIIECKNNKKVTTIEVNESVILSLDELCENVSNIIDEFGYVIPDYVPLLVTGSAINEIRGTKEHIANRLGMAVNVVAPPVPLMNKPEQSSLFSLMNLALEQN